ncbi:hypothetical protein [Planococcus salinarum]|uniref:hypothetical protein n=1 Tax=Planococcus salinarum TaxID=622695 RepID=UPI00115CB55A|nr:hypothetical protein [Planococcus salinarum]TAA73018.1 hypothetical protein D2909_02985 [Planococcus salinarum]
MRSSIRTLFILMGAGTVFYLFMKYSYLVGFLFLNSIIGALTFLAALIGAIWATVKLDRIISESRYEFPVHSAAILLMSLFFAYQMFASHFYSEQYLKAEGLEKVEQLFELAEMDLDENELRARAEQIAVKESAYVISLYGVNSRPDGIEELEVLEFKRRYHAYDLVVGGNGKSASFTFIRDGLDFKISGNSIME